MSGTVHTSFATGSTSIECYGLRMIGTKNAGFIGVALLAIAAACGDDVVADDPGADGVEQGNSNKPGNVTPAVASGLPCDVDAVLKSRCQTCHAANPQFGASVPLVTWADLQKPGPGASADKKIYELVKERIHSAERPMPPGAGAKLPPEDVASLDAWIAGGAPTSNASCSNAGPVDAVKALPCTPDTTLKATKPFTMAAGSPADQYECFGVDVDVTKKRHVTALAPHVDNKEIVHHILLFQAPKSESTEPFACAAFGSTSWKLVAGWAPGADNFILPDAAGFPEETGTTHWVLQIHYNNTKTKTGSDLSGYDLCTTEDLRPNDAGIIGLGSINFSIPPRSSKTVRCDYRLGSEFKGVKFFNAWPHMHTYGTMMSTERLVGGKGTPETILAPTPFSFEAQLNYPITKSVESGDVMRTRCSWKNTTDKSIGFGEATGDEMCFDFVAYYPNIPDKVVLGVPVFTWITPSAAAGCTEE